MKCLDLTLETPAENLALDEALLDQAESGEGPNEMLRFWEPHEPFVVIGRSSRHAAEVNLAACRERGIAVLRRCSGGAAVVAGPGCLMYAAVLSFQQHPHLRMIEAAHCFVLSNLLRAITRLVPDAAMRGTSDLALHERKFSGNSLRVKHDHMLYHGTILYDFPLDLIGQCLRTPPRQPDYRNQRDHLAFVTNLTTTGAKLKRELLDTWSVDAEVTDWPREQVEHLVETRYSQASWHERI
jgi:lipoate-protein ligase A